MRPVPAGAIEHTGHVTSPPAAGPVRTRYRPGHPLSVRLVTSALRHGGGDPCWRRGADGTVWWATSTPAGPGLLALRTEAAAGEVDASAWGAGAEWLVDGVPDLLGASDDPSTFLPSSDHPRLVAAWRARPGYRVPRTRRVLDALAAACIEQRVTGVEALAAWASLVRSYGEAAPGAPAAPGGPAHGMRTPPTAAAWRSVPSWAWLRAGVDLSRRGALLAGAGTPHGLERTLALPPERVEPVLRTLPGVGRWTAAETRQRAHGDPDAFSFDDYHVAKDVSWALTGEVLDDEGCAEVIAPYAGHRFRVQRLLELDGASRPRRGPRMTLPAHSPQRLRRR